MEAMDRLQGVIQGSSKSKYSAAFNSLLQKCVMPLTAQALDLRSAIVKKCSETIIRMAVVLGNDLDQIAERFISINSLLKVVLSGSRILAEAGHEAILAILQNVVCPKYLSIVTPVDLYRKSPTR